MKIGYLGTGVWGFCLASLLAAKGYSVVCWTLNESLARHLNDTREHPKLKGSKAEGDIRFTTSLEDALTDIDLLVESVTSAGIRPVFQQVKSLGVPNCPITLTSKGIEQGTGLPLSEVVLQTLGDTAHANIGCISGPSFATEVVKKLPTSVVSSAYEKNTMMTITEAFNTSYFRVYPNPDMKGVSFCGALKNVIAIACGMSDGLLLGQSCKSALMTRGLHEIKKLACASGCAIETVYGLAGMGDLCLTCSSTVSRNHRFGHLLAQGLSPTDAKEKIGMVVEGAYTAVSALELGHKLKIAMPITEAVYDIIYQELNPKDAALRLMERDIKEEYL